MERLEQRITSVELCKIINELRREEKGENAKGLLHKSLMEKIRKELQIMKNLGLNNQQNILLVDYKDSKGEKRPCYSLNASGMRQILNSESTYVRCKTEEYIKKLENENEKLKSSVPQIAEEDLLILRAVKSNSIEERVVAIAEYGELKLKQGKEEIREKEVKPLQGKVEELSPLAEMLIKRFEKGENIGWKDINDLYNFKRGACSKWAIDNGYIYKNKKDVRDKGKGYFQRYVINGFKNICITPDGIKLIDKHQDEIEKK